MWLLSIYRPAVSNRKVILSEFPRAKPRGRAEAGSRERNRARASGLNLVVAAITLWDTVYLEPAAEALARSRPVDQSLFQHVSTLVPKSGFSNSRSLFNGRYLNRESG